jgi:hypothetical protein
MRNLVLLALAVLPLISCVTPPKKKPPLRTQSSAVSASPSSPGSATAIVKAPAPAAQQALEIQHQRIAALVEELNALKANLTRTLDEVSGEREGTKSDKIYQNADLNSLAGIRAARRRALLFGNSMDRFGQQLEGFWALLADKVNTNDLDEPLATQLRMKLAGDESVIYPKYRAWIRAAHEDIEAINHYLDVNERYHGQFKWGEGSLTFTNPEAAKAISKTQITLIAAERHYRQAAAEALKNQGDTISFAVSEMRDIEKRIATYESPGSIRQD